MPVFKKKWTQGYTIIPNSILRDRNLAFRDIGLLVWMLSKQQDWRFSYEGMLAERALDGKAALQTSVRALKAAGYLTIEKKRKQGKLQEAVWSVYDVPCIENQYMARKGAERTHDTQSASPHTDSPYTANLPRINTEKGADAVAAVKGGAQQQGSYYRDPVTGEWRRRNG